MVTGRFGQTGINVQRLVGTVRGLAHEPVQTLPRQTEETRVVRAIATDNSAMRETAQVSANKTLNTRTSTIINTKT